MRGRGDFIGNNMNGTYTMPVNSFMPNAYGLYNMAGNVNEWVLDVYRATTNEVVEEYNSFRGNVYRIGFSLCRKYFKQITVFGSGNARQYA